MIAPDWPARYLAEPIVWVAGGDEPLACDCWGFVRRVQREVFGRDLPRLQLADGPDFVTRALAEFPGRSAWRKRTAGEQPHDGDIVMIDASDDDDHVGVWAAADRGGVLHCTRTTFGVLFTRRHQLPMLGYTRLRVWTHHADQ